MVEQDPHFIIRRNRFLKQSGQAVVEYVLLLVITVGLIMAASKVFKNLNDFMNRYIGDYTICLMEHGELPNLGVAAAGQKKHADSGACDQKFEGFTFGSGRPPGGAGRSGRSGSSRSGSSSKSDADGSSKSDADRRKSDAAKKDSDRDGTNKGFRKKSAAGRGSSPYTSGQISRDEGFGTADGPSSDVGNEKVKIIEEEKEKSKNAKNANRRSSRNLGYQKLKYRVITGELAETIEKNSGKKPRGSARTVSALIGDSANQIGPYKKIFIPPDSKPVEVIQDDGSDFAFGNILRWLMIGAMILAVIVFFGGQIMNYSNSKE